jgi:hypothetical protein
MILREVGIFEAQEMKFGIARGGEFFVVIGLLKSPALGEGGDRKESYRDFEKTALHGIRFIMAPGERPVWNIIYE